MDHRLRKIAGVYAACAFALLLLDRIETAEHETTSVKLRVGALEREERLTHLRLGDLERKSNQAKESAS